MSSRTPFLAPVAEEGDDEERGDHDLRLIVSNEAYEIADGKCCSCTPWKVVIGVVIAALVGLLMITW